MRIAHNQLTASTLSSCPSLVAVFGDSPLLTMETCDLLLDQARQLGFSEIERLTVLAGFDWQSLVTARQTQSLFGDKVCLFVRMDGRSPGRDGSRILQTLAEASATSPLNHDVRLVLSLGELDWREQKSAWFTALEKQAWLIEANAPAHNELPGWIAGRLKRQQQQLSHDGLIYFAQKVEGNLLAAHQEIQKLALLYPAGELSLDNLKAALHNVSRYDLDDLRTALLEQNPNRLINTLNGLFAEGEAPPLLLWAMMEELRALLYLKSQSSARPLDSLLKEQRIWGQRATRIRRVLAKTSLDSLKDCVKHGAELDLAIKGALPAYSLQQSFTALALRVARMS